MCHPKEKERKRARFAVGHGARFGVSRPSQWSKNGFLEKPM